MALPSSGSIAMSQINTELGRGSTSAISLDAAENGSYAGINSCSPSRPSSSNPAAMSEWRGYNHSFACCNAPSISSNSVTSSSFTINVSYSNCSAMHLEYSSNGGSTWQTSTGGCTTPLTLSGLASSTAYQVRVRITCTSTNGYSGYSNTITMTTSAGCPAYGTYLSQFCSGCTLYYRYANGSCGTYDQVYSDCTTACGGCCCSPGYGTYLSQYCSGYDLYYTYSNGCNGTYSSLIESNSTTCGYQEPSINCYSYFGDGSGSWLGRDCNGNIVEGWSCCYGEYLFCGTSISYGGYGDLNQVCGTSQCPTPDMPILINPNTWVTAGDLKVGDYIYTKHETTGEWGSYQVTSANPGTNTVSRTVIGGQEIKVSSNHKFLTESMGFVPLSELWVGAKVQTVNGLAEIESIESIGVMEVIQIEVDQAHTYVIGEVVSHNRKEEGLQ
jgi:hypothetical protein